MFPESFQAHGGDEGFTVRAEGGGLVLSLAVTYPRRYPDEAPQLAVKPLLGLSDKDAAEILRQIQSQAEVRDATKPRLPSNLFFFQQGYLGLGSPRRTSGSRREKEVRVGEVMVYDLLLLLQASKMTAQQILFFCVC